MEFFVLVCVAVVVATVMIDKGSRRHGKKRGGPRHARPVSTRATAPAGAKAAASRRFGARTGRRQSCKRIINGRPFIFDGDTLRIQRIQLRLYGIDAPEMHHPYGRQAKWALYALCKGQTVRAEILETDNYGRTVARCYLEDGRDLSAEMVKLGLAIDWPNFSGGEYRCLERPGVRNKLWLADARQKGRMHVWQEYEARQGARLAQEQAARR